MNSDELGKEIRKFRLELGVGLRELSRLSGISPASLTTIEKGATSPTLTTLDKILKGLKTDLAEFFSNSALPPDKSVYRSDELRVLSDENRQYVFLIPKRSDVKFEFIHETIMKTDNETEWDAHDSDLGGYILSGGAAKLEIKEVGEWTLKKGDSFYVKANQTHRLYATSKKAIKLITVLF